MAALPGTSPVVVGGVGGSGTRLVAAVVREAGFFIGDDLNPALDNLAASLLFNRPGILDCPDDEFTRTVTAFTRRMAGDGRVAAEDVAWASALAGRDNPPHDADWMRERLQRLLAGRSTPPAARWGWKEPNAHVILGRLAAVLPAMRFVLVSRSGLDMAGSGKHNQAMRWGAMLLGRPFEPTPRYLLAYWCAAHRRALAHAASLPDRFLHVTLEDLCAAPEPGLRRLLAFVGGDPDAAERLAALVRPPASLGRFREAGLHGLDPDDVAYVASLGFPTA
ncbi:MAG: sulfotransferase [Pirellulales bacterium]